MIQLKAAVLETCTTDRPFAESRPLTLQTIDAEPPGPGEVLVRIRAVSLCRSDLSVITGVRAWPMPIVPGHEASGIVEEVGSHDSPFAAGDQVVLVYQPQCGTCSCCVGGDGHLCEPGLAANRAGALLTGGPRLKLNGEPIHHHMGLSAFAEMAVISEKSLVKVEKDLPADIAALFGCAALCGAGSIVNTGRVRPGETVAVAAVVELTGGGVDCALESAGVLEAFETAYASAKRGGRVVTLGLVSPKTPYALDVAAHVTGAKALIGSYMGSCNAPLDIPKFVGLYKSGKFPVDKLITKRLPLTDINLALDNMADSRELRQVLTP